MQMPALTATHAIVAINIAIGVVTLWPVFFETSVLAGGLFPARLVDGDAAFAGISPLLPAILTPISSAFLHGGIMHVLLNMIMLITTGREVEKVLGWKSFLVLYSAGMVCAGLAEIIAAPHSMAPVIGASGAISAVIAAYTMLFPNNEPRAWGPIPGKYAHPLKLLTGWILINAMLKFAAPQIGINVAIYAHIGGFIAGLLLAHPLLLWRFRKA
jgi:membrane associated rhomboid family serine protease